MSEDQCVLGECQSPELCNDLHACDVRLGQQRIMTERTMDDLVERLYAAASSADERFARILIDRDVLAAAAAEIEHLHEHRERNSVIEECARAADNAWHTHCVSSYACAKIARCIYALKSKPAGEKEG